MELLSKDQTRTIVSAAVAMVAGYVVKEALTFVWKRIAKNNPPKDPSDPTEKLGESIAWTVASSVLVGVASMAASRVAISLLDSAEEA